MAGSGQTPLQVAVQLKGLPEGKNISCGNCEEGDAKSYCMQCAVWYCDKCLSIHNEWKLNAKHCIANIKDIEGADLSSLADSGNVKVSFPASLMGGKSFVVCLSFQKELGSAYKVPPSLPLTCHLISCDSSQATVCDIKETEVGKYSASFTPSSRGEYQLKIQVGGIDIDGSPFKLYALPSPQMRNEPLKIINRIYKPTGIAINKDGHFMVTNTELEQVIIYDRKGKELGQFGSGFKYPYAIAFTKDGHVLLTENYLLKKLTPEGQIVKSAGGKGIGREIMEFYANRGVAVHPKTGQIHVVDNGNHRIQVLNDDFTFSHVIEIDDFEFPDSVAFDSAGYMYVTNTGNATIEVFTQDGKFLRQFASDGEGEGQLGWPLGILVDDYDFVYVVENHNHRISVFTTSGEFVRHIGGEGQLFNPCYIAMDDQGYLYITDQYNNRIVVWK